MAHPHDTSSKEPRPLLVTIPISHYCERARWALDLSEVDYHERHHLQMFSWVAAVRAGGRRTLPVLVTPDEALSDSEQIVRWASDRGARLLPREGAEAREVAELSTRFADVFGVETRRFAYSCVFGARDRCMPYNEGRSPPWQAASMRLGFGIVQAVAVSYLGVRAADVARAIDCIERVLDEVAERLSDQRKYLVGERFSSADLTFATMAAPCVLPDRYGVPLPHVDELPEEGRARVVSWREHPAGRFALELYRQRPAPRGNSDRPLRVPPRVDGFPP